VGAALRLAVQLGHQSFGMCALRERVAVRSVRRGDDVAVLERAADAHRARLLADRHVEEAGQLAGAEALLDLLFEAADEEHLPQHVLQVTFRQARSLLLHRHGPECTVGAVRLVEQWNQVAKRPGSELERRPAEPPDRQRESARARRCAACAGRSWTLRRHGPLLRHSQRPRARTRGRTAPARPHRRRANPRPADAHGTSEAEAPQEVARHTLAAEWQAALEMLPSDWSDLVAELELDSSVDVDRAAVLCAPSIRCS
jgi:hypothetical protein